MKLLFHFAAYAWLATLVGSGHPVVAQPPPGDSLPPTTARDVERLAAYRDSARAYIYSQPDTAQHFAETGLQLAERLHDLAVQETLHLYLAIIGRNRNDYKSSLAHYERTLALSRALGDPNKVARAYSGIGSLYLSNSNYTSTGNYAIALDNFLQALRLRDSISDQRMVASLMNNIGIVYWNLKEYEKSISYYTDALRIAEEIEDKNLISKQYNNLGLVTLDQSELEKSRIYFEKALEIEKTLGNDSQLAMLYNNLGLVHTKMGRSARALFYYSEALKLEKDAENQSTTIAIYINMGDLYSADGQTDIAEQYYEKCLALLDQADDKSVIRDVYKSIAENYERAEKLPQAVAAYKRLMAVKDSLLNEEKTMQIATVETQFGVEAKEREIEILRKDREINELSLKRRQAVLYAFVISAVLMLLLAALIYSRYLLSRRATRELLVKNQQIERQRDAIEERTQRLEGAQQKIEQQNAMLTTYTSLLEQRVEDSEKAMDIMYRDLASANGELDTFMYRASHDLKGPIATIAGLCSVALLDQVEPKAAQYIEMVQKTANKMSYSLNRLIKIDVLKKHRCKPVSLSLADFIGQIMARNFAQLDAQYGLKTEVIVPVEAVYQTDPYLIEIVLHNLIENAVQFREEGKNSYLRIEILMRRNSFLLRVSDNGIGIKPDLAEKIFHMFFKGSERSVGSGLGLYMAQIAAQKLGTQVVYRQSSLQETVFEMEVPHLPTISNPADEHEGVLVPIYRHEVALFKQHSS